MAERERLADDPTLDQAGAAVALIVGVRASALRLHRNYGLVERLFYLSSIAWFLIVSIEPARIAG